MLISDRFGFAFVHIPKCAGSTVRQQLREVDPDLFELAERRIHPVLGKIDTMHLPLSVLREHFPDAFARLRATHSYALTRDPQDRFRSSASEFVKTYHGKRLSDFTRKELEAVFDEIVAVLETGGELLPRRYVHSTPQERYVRLDGEDVVSQRYAVEDIDAFFADLNRRTGASLDAGSRANEDLAFRVGGSERWLFRVNGTLKSLLPRGAYQGLKRQVKPLLVRERPSETDELFASRRVTSFVRDFYAADVALHAADLAARTESRTASGGRATA